MTDKPPRAVVFGYHDVGVRGLAVLLSLGIDVPLVVTHEDDPNENIWFGSVADLASLNDIPVIKPDDPNAPDVVEKVGACRPDWIFSFYYRRMLSEELLALPTRGASNLHGSLLPRYRGRVPINWAVLHGESQTGASLHRMELKPDAGPLVDQEAVAILPNDTAYDVFQKVTGAAERVLLRSVPAMRAGRLVETPLNLEAGSYFGRRRPEDGRIDWTRTAWEIHNLIRAVAPPYPGAFFDTDGSRVHIYGSYYRGADASEPGVRVYWRDGRCWADCADGKRICLTSIAVDGSNAGEAEFSRRFGGPELEIT
ncbi:MAG: formyltransferase [bacterium]